MSEAPRVLVVEDDELVLGRAMRWLRMSGYVAVGATSSDRARRLLDTDTYDLLVTKARLSVFSGVRLMQLAYLEWPKMRVVLVGERPDAMLDMEARRYGARYVTTPDSREAFIEIVVNALPEARPHQRWPRKRLKRQLPVRVRQYAGLLVDVSYGGLCFEVPAGSTEPPSPFEVTVDEFDLQVRAQMVWCQQDAKRIRYGAMLVAPQPADQSRWRMFVDLLPDQATAHAAGA